MTKHLRQLSNLLDESFQSKSVRSTSIIHAFLLRTGLLASLIFHTKLFLSYAACPNNVRSVYCLLNSMDSDAGDPASRWNSIVSGLSRHGFPFLTLETLSFMHRTGIPLDSYTQCSSLTACASTRSLLAGKQIHGYVWKSGWKSNIFVMGALVDFYAKSCAVRDARWVYDEIPLKNVVCANALLAGYVEAKLWNEGLALVHGMPVSGLEPDGFTLSMILRFCAELPAVGLGMQAHAWVFRQFCYLGSDVFLLSSLVEMYGRCGLVQKARLVFDLAGCRTLEKETNRDVVLWTSMLNAYSRNGWFDVVIRTFEEMLMEGTAPDEIAFLAVLSACSHMGHVVQGLGYFESMCRDYRIIPCREHYACMVDLFCRAGELENAWKFANEMALGEAGGSTTTETETATTNVGNGVSVWGALLSACREWGNVGMGKIAAQRALELEPGNVGVYVELSNLYAKVGMWDEIGELRESMKESGLKKEVGCSWLELTK